MAVERRPRGAPLEDPGDSSDRAADDLFLLLVGEDDIGGERFELRAESRAADIPNRAPRREVDADPSAAPAGAFDRTRRREADGLAQQRVPRHVQVVAVHEPRLLDLLGAELDGDARSGHIVRSPDGSTSATMTPFPVGSTGPRRPTPRSRSREAAIAPASSAPRLPTKCELPPRAAIQAATFAAWPPGRSTMRDVASAPVASGCSRRTITSRTRSPRQKIDNALRSSHGTRLQLPRGDRR